MDSTSSSAPSETTYRVAPRVAYGLAVATGLLYFVAFPGIDVWPLSFVALAPLMIALKNQPVRRAAGLGWAAGFTMTMVGFYWLLDMLKTFSGFPTPVCLLFMAILCGYQGGRIALMGYLYGRAEARGWPAGPVFALAFIASELVYPLLFPWYFGATVHQVPALTQIAELGNPILVGLTLVAVNLAVTELVWARLVERAPRLRVVAALAAVPLVSAGYGAIRISQVDKDVASAPKAEVGVVQANMSLMAKRHEAGEGLRRHLLLTRQLQSETKLDLVVWSETSVTSAVPVDEVDEEYPRRFTRALGVPAVFGAVLYKEVPDARRFVLYNSALLSDATGAIQGRFDKTYLLAFGEFLPFGEEFPVLYEWSPNSGKFSRGTSLQSLPLGDHKLTVHICYEDVIPSFVNSMMRADSGNLLVNITNDAWFGDSTEPWIHLALSKFRAIEQRRFLARSTNSGVSAIIDPVGRVTAHTETFKEQAVHAPIAWLTGRTPYNLWGDAPWWLATAAIVAMGFVTPRSRRSAKTA
ncbi:MAG TPA: apolipoprotein N-acyltransferase [Polyangiaceae bacterium]|nr:apolipoprotein N-acyltransferase [Polyangiaceae bacterium]